MGRRDGLLGPLPPAAERTCQEDTSEHNTARKGAAGAAGAPRATGKPDSFKGVEA